MDHENGQNRRTPHKGFSISLLVAYQERGGHSFHIQHSVSINNPKRRLGWKRNYTKYDTYKAQIARMVFHPFAGGAPIRGCSFNRLQLTDTMNIIIFICLWVTGASNLQVAILLSQDVRLFFSYNYDVRSRQISVARSRYNPPELSPT